MSHPLSFALRAMTLVLALLAPQGVLAGGSSECARAVDAVPPVLWETPVIYESMRALDAAGCQTLGDQQFDDLLGRVELNLVSYALLEDRLPQGSAPVAAQMIAEHVEVYDAAMDGVDLNGVLPLLDIAFYRCDGAEDCVGEMLRGWLGGRPLRSPAECLYGLDGACKADDLPIPLWNTTSLKRKGGEDGVMRRARSEFLCQRYIHCSQQED